MDASAQPHTPHRHSEVATACRFMAVVLSAAAVLHSADLYIGPEVFEESQWGILGVILIGVGVTAMGASSILDRASRPWLTFAMYTVPAIPLFVAFATAIGPSGTPLDPTVAEAGAPAATAVMYDLRLLAPFITAGSLTLLAGAIVRGAPCTPRESDDPLLPSGAFVLRSVGAGAGFAVAACAASLFLFPDSASATTGLIGLGFALAGFAAFLLARGVDPPPASTWHLVLYTVAAVAVCAVFLARLGAGATSSGDEYSEPWFTITIVVYFYLGPFSPLIMLVAMCIVVGSLIGDTRRLRRRRAAGEAP